MRVYKMESSRELDKNFDDEIWIKLCKSFHLPNPLVDENLGCRVRIHQSLFPDQDLNRATLS